MFMLSLMLSARAGDAPAVSAEAQAKPRLEAHTGRDGADGGEVIVASQRTRLGATLSLGSLSVRALVQDVRVFGEESSTLTDFSADGLDMHVGYLEWAEDGTGVRVGRQELILHEHRLIGNVNWLQQARAFDGVKVWSGGEAWSGEAAAVVTGLDEAGSSAAGMAYARLGTRGDTRGDIVYILDQSTARERMLHTVGLYATTTAGTLSARAEGYYQLGETDGRSVSAFMAGVRGTLAPEARGKPTVTLWYDLLSGDGDEATEKGAFDTLYATNHKFYGLTDIAWFRVGATADGRGLQDAALKLSLSPVESVTLKADAHVFLAADAEYIGTEPDLTVAWTVAKGFAVSGGVGLFLPESGDPDLWSFLQANARL